jgi:hypothetical protein
MNGAPIFQRLPDQFAGEDQLPARQPFWPELLG